MKRLLELYRLSIKIDTKDAVDLLGETKRDGVIKSPLLGPDARSMFRWYILD